ncbi:MAG: deacylase, partial [Chloroflexi bacterium]|nr:deacylase [Chloroflexota bacterium]
MGPQADRLDPPRASWIADAWAQVSAEELAKLTLDLANIPSPSGSEKELAQFAAEWLNGNGLQARYQPIDDFSGNAIGRAGHSVGGPHLLLYSPIDTAFAPGEDYLGLDTHDRPDLRLPASRDGDYVIGLGAENPKAYMASVMVAAAAVARAGIPLTGSLIVGLGAGGMAVDGSGDRQHIGHGAGAAFMLEQGTRADFAIVAKPGWAVSWEEAGVCWFKVTVKGDLHYVGSRQRQDYRHAIEDAAGVAEALREWFPKYSQSHTSGLVAPQATIGSIHGG